jgi:hypothetical protein
MKDHTQLKLKHPGHIIGYNKGIRENIAQQGFLI